MAHSFSGQLSFDFDQVPQLLLTPDELYGALDEERLRRWKEDGRLEKKPAGMQALQLGEYFSMWANTGPEGGLLIVGIDRDNEFKGCLKKGTDKVNEIEKCAEIYCPDAVYESKRVPIIRDEDGQPDFLIAFRIAYNDKRTVKTANGKVFIRRGDSKFELRTPDEIRQLQVQKGEVSLETEDCGLAYPDDFQAGLISAFARTVKAKKTWNAEHTNEEVLRLFHLGKQGSHGFVPNLACALLFAKDPRNVVPGCWVRFIRFEGETEGTGEKWNAVKDVAIEGTVPEQIQRAAEVTSAQLRTFSKLGPGGKFITAPEYPQSAWYEAIVNACVHRSYGNGSQNVPIFIKMFDDRLVVESPGAFPPFVTPENIYFNSVARNPFLMEAMFYLDYVKYANEGTRRMKEAMKEMELPGPEFVQLDATGMKVRATLRNGIRQRRVWVDSDVTKFIGEAIAHTLDENERRSVNYIAENGKANVSEITRLTGMAWETAKRMLLGLVKRGILRHIHSGKERNSTACFILKKPEDFEQK